MGCSINPLLSVAASAVRSLLAAIYPSGWGTLVC